MSFNGDHSYNIPLIETEKLVLVHPEPNKCSAKAMLCGPRQRPKFAQRSSRFQKVATAVHTLASAAQATNVSP